MPYLLGASILTIGVVLVVIFAYRNRDDPAWQRDAPRVTILLYGQLALIAMLLVIRALFSD